MRLIGLLFVVGIIGFVWSRRGASVGSTSAEEELFATPAARPALVSSATTPATPAPRQSSSLRRPIDRTRSVLEQVKGRNGAGEF